MRKFWMLCSLGFVALAVPACDLTEPSGPPVQCEAYPVCNEGETQVASKADCPAGASCYSSTLCGYTIWCTDAKVTCAALPTCDPGDQQVAGPSACLQDDAACYQRSICGSTIWCTGPRT
jgi:hypothetical protein